MDIKNLIHLIAPVVVTIIWLIRLEAKILYLEKDHITHKNDYKDQYSLMWAKIDFLSNNISMIMQSLARIEENIKNIRKE